MDKVQCYWRAGGAVAGEDQIVVQNRPVNDRCLLPQSPSPKRDFQPGSLGRALLRFLNLRVSFLVRIHPPAKAAFGDELQ